jgi:hypothetical protein
MTQPLLPLAANTYLKSNITSGFYTPGIWPFSPVAFSTDGYWSTDQNDKIQEAENWTSSYSCNKFSHISAYCHFKCTQKMLLLHINIQSQRMYGHHNRLENKERLHMIILILVWVLTLQHYKRSKAELYSYYMIILRAVIMIVFTCHPGQISLYCKD